MDFPLPTQWHRPVLSRFSEFSTKPDAEGMIRVVDELRSRERPWAERLMPFLGSLRCIPAGILGTPYQLDPLHGPRNLRLHNPSSCNSLSIAYQSRIGRCPFTPLFMLYFLNEGHVERCVEMGK
jgi:hypothetical protein